MATADFNTAQVRERQSRFAEVEADDTVDVKPVAVPAADLDADAAAPDTASMSAQQIDDARDAQPLQRLGQRRPDALQCRHLGEQRIEDVGPHD